MTARLLVSTGGAFLSIGLLIPAVPRYVTGPLDAQTGWVGVSLAVTAAAGLIARPLAGRVADRSGRRAAVFAGALLLCGSSLALLLAGNLSLFLLLRGVAGVGEALVYVGLAALASDHRRPGAAINHFSVAVNAGLLTGPALAETLYAAAGFTAVWIAAAISALVPAILAAALPKTTLPKTTLSKPNAGPDPSPRHVPSRRPRSALRAGFGYLASVWGYTVVSAFLPLHLAALGTGSGGAHFLVYGIVLLAVRLAGQRLLATASPARLAVASLLLTGVGSILLAAWPSPAGTWCAIALTGAGQGLGLPAFLRMAVHGVPPGERGSAVATTTAFFDIGFLSAALTLGALAGQFGLAGGFVLAGAVSAAGALLFLPPLFRHDEHRDEHQGAPRDPSRR
ncbi:MFS transporter [Nonomuraea endophytica]|uniref:MFS family permease n=1 Tax=Nonomuraea endophytica TaxID=714136 RepID=A0A7W8A4Q9_9ACTN|nr:MFS transporter [Nonomuraea endophytica]MBB5079547.1 MFS family permease [Nonomuraea endophytica]